MGSSHPASSPVHLLVLSHGLWGSSENLKELERQLRKGAGSNSNIEILNSKINEHGKDFRTYDGIDQCGLRLAADVVHTVSDLEAAGREVTCISFIGYSLGGLITRYACGRLLTANWIARPKGSTEKHQQHRHEHQHQHHRQQQQQQQQEFQQQPNVASPGPSSPTNTPQHSEHPLACTHSQHTHAAHDSRRSNTCPCSSKHNPNGHHTSRTCSAPLHIPRRERPLKPVCFITVATPHLGSWRLPTSITSRFFNSMVTALASRSGAQLMLIDSDYQGRPLLVNMCDPSLPFYAALAAFKHRALMANVYNDRMVPWCTAFIDTENKYETFRCRPEPISQFYPSVVCLPEQQLQRAEAHANGASPHKSSNQQQHKSQQQQQQQQNGKVTVPSADIRASAVHDMYQESAENGQHSQQLQRQAQQQEQEQQEQQQVQQQQQQQQQQQTSEPGIQRVKEVARSLPYGYKGRVLIFILLLLFLPITLPLVLALLIYLVVTGRTHAAKANKLKIDHSWLTASSFVSQQQLHHQHQHQQQQQQQQQQEDRISSEGLGKSQCEQAQESSPTGHGFTNSPHVMVVKEAPSSAEGGAASLGRIGSGDVDVLFDDSTQMHVHEGIIQDSAKGGIVHRQHQQQVWMSHRLNELGWQKCAVDTRHYHAHAAIIVRNPVRFRANADCLQYLIREICMPQMHEQE